MVKFDKEVKEKPLNKNSQNKNMNQSALSRKDRRRERNLNFNKTSKNNHKSFHKQTNEEILEKYNFNFSRGAEWYKKTDNKINEVKDELDKKFYTPEKKAEKINFIRKLKDKLKDYRDAINFAEKYKKVRFVERRKLERMLIKYNKEIQALENKIKQESDLNPNQNILSLKISLNDTIMKRDETIKNINYVKLNKNIKNKKLIEKKLDSLQDTSQITSFKELGEENKEEDEIIDNEENTNKTKYQKDMKTKPISNKKSKKLRSAYDYELEVLNNNEIQNDDFFIVD